MEKFRMTNAYFILFINLLETLKTMKSKNSNVLSNIAEHFELKGCSKALIKACSLQSRIIASCDVMMFKHVLTRFFLPKLNRISIFFKQSLSIYNFKMIMLAVLLNNIFFKKTHKTKLFVLLSNS